MKRYDRALSGFSAHATVTFIRCRAGTSSYQLRGDKSGKSDVKVVITDWKMPARTRGLIFPSLFVLKTRQIGRERAESDGKLPAPARSADLNGPASAGGVA